MKPQTARSAVTAVTAETAVTATALKKGRGSRFYRGFKYTVISPSAALNFYDNHNKI